MKLAVLITSDPKGGDEALGRAFNAMALAAEAHQREDEVQVAFIGAGTRWPAELVKLNHPAHALYDAVRPLVAGASKACSVVFGAEDGVKQSGVKELSDHQLAGTPGMASVRGYLAQGFQTLVF
ncbi:MAG TPA: hypothetical protein VIG99_23125 [Myxococcaceae bacterium]|jgi:hypothetical protein